jgi:hypothetical protein
MKYPEEAKGLFSASPYLLIQDQNNQANTSLNNA